MNEQYFEYNECSKLKVFINNEKAVFNAEYLKKYKINKEENILCKKYLDLKFNPLILDIELKDKYRISCN